LDELAGIFFDGVALAINVLQVIVTDVRNVLYGLQKTNAAKNTVTTAPTKCGRRLPMCLIQGFWKKRF
jgi:hypothetical protein